MNRKRICLALDLKDDTDAIERYKAWHRPGAPPAAVTRSLREAGIADMEIYLTGNRLFMIMEVEPHYSSEAKARADALNPEVQAWEALMGELQQVLPDFQGHAASGKWRVMECIYSLAAQP